MSNKKAVSPLIATVLLVMIVVSIGAAVMVVIQGLSEEQISNIKYQQEAIKCGTEVALRPVQVNNAYRMCFNAAEFAIQVQNQGQKDVERWNVLVIGDTTKFMENIGPQVVTSNVTTILFRWGGATGNITGVQKIQLVPQISNGNSYIPCTIPTMEFDGDTITGLSDCRALTVSWENSSTAYT